MKREGDISIVETLDKHILSCDGIVTLHSGGCDGDYNFMSEEKESVKFSRRYQIKCSKFKVLRGFIDVLLEFDYRIGRGRLVLRDDCLSAFLGTVPYAEDYLWKLQRYFSNNSRRAK